VQRSRRTFFALIDLENWSRVLYKEEFEDTKGGNQNRRRTDYTMTKRTGLHYIWRFHRVFFSCSFNFLMPIILFVLLRFLFTFFVFWVEFQRGGGGWGRRRRRRKRATEEEGGGGGGGYASLFACSFKFLNTILSIYCGFVHPCSICSSYIRFVWYFIAFFRIQLTFLWVFYVLFLLYFCSWIFYL